MAPGRPKTKKVSNRGAKGEVKKSTTTMKVSRKTSRFIDVSSVSDESVDETIRRLLKLSSGIEKPKEPLSLATTIKVSRDTMTHIQKEAQEGESRDHTLSRLLGIKQDDGNVQVVTK